MEDMYCDQVPVKYSSFISISHNVTHVSATNYPLSSKLNQNHQKSQETFYF